MQIKIDGMLSGTGIRIVGAGYIPLEDLSISEDLKKDIRQWQYEYEQLHYIGFSDQNANTELDKRGCYLTIRVRAELPNDKVTYYSAAYLKDIPV